jgi:hypothetical protein
MKATDQPVGSLLRIELLHLVMVVRQPDIILGMQPDSRPRVWCVPGQIQNYMGSRRRKSEFPAPIRLMSALPPGSGSPSSYGLRDATGAGRSGKRRVWSLLRQGLSH